MRKAYRPPKQGIAVVWESVPDTDPEALDRVYELLWKNLHRRSKNPALTKKDNPLSFRSEPNQ